MLPVDQTTFGAPHGDCLPACLASILHLAIAEVLIENRPALDMLRRYRGPEVVVFDDPPYLRTSVHGDRDPLYRHEMMEPEQHEESLTESLLHPGPYLLCSYRNDLYDRMLLGAGWSVVEAQTIAEHGQHRVEALYLNRVAAASRPREQLSFGGRA